MKTAANSSPAPSEKLRRHDVELMAPVGSFESLRAAIAAGADSVYFGVGELNMRSRSAACFSPDDMAAIVVAAHKARRKAYLALNTVIYDEQIEQMRALVDRAAAGGIDAIIASDQATILYARGKGVNVHISTQLNVSNFETLRFYAQWADVVVLARELSLDQVAAISGAVRRHDVRGPSGRPVRLEMFAHGALCMAVSGKCYLSLHDCGESANRGACRQICRRSYTLTDRETGAQIDAEGPYLLSPKDLCTIDFLDRVVEAGVRVLKIEGRARSGEYVKRVVECYDEALRALAAGTYTPELAASLRRRLGEVFNRGFWEGYYLGAQAPELSRRYGSSATRRKVYVGKVTNWFRRVSVAEITVEAAPLEVGNDILVMGPTTGVVECRAEGIMVDERPAAVALQGQLCSLKLPVTVRRGDKLYKVVEDK